ncbi:hypothetical protein N9059_00155, partial [bacterium]|nr:hypothetical protein [bacterium]
MKTTIIQAILFLSCSLSLPIQAQDHSDPHGTRPSSELEIFHASPFQLANLIPAMNEVFFPITTTSANTQAFFNQGMAYLYASWPQEAERSFHTAHLTDPDALMPQWGIAISHLLRDHEEALPWLYDLPDDKVTDLPFLEAELLLALPNDTLVETGIPSEWRPVLIAGLRKVIKSHSQENEPKALLAAILSDAWYGYMDDFDESPDSVLKLMAEIAVTHPEHPAHRLGLYLWSNGLRHDPYKTPKAYFDLKTMQPCPAIARQWSIASRYLAERERFREALQLSEIATRIEHQWLKQAKTAPDLA